LATEVSSALSEQLLAIISEDRDALQRPIEESERRIELMKETINEAERSMRRAEFSVYGGSSSGFSEPLCRKGTKRFFPFRVDGI